MQLTRFTDYSLRALIYVGAFPDRLCTIQEIAAAYAISENHLMKVISQLAAKGYVETVRGKRGGVRLARPPHLINVGAVVRDMEDRFELAECFGPGIQDCPLMPACTLRAVLSDAAQKFLESLNRYTLVDLLGPQVLTQFGGRGRTIVLAHARARGAG